MHDFEGRIDDWRRELNAKIRDPEAVEELEEHLREILAAESSGKSADDAWTSAVHRLGECDALAQEYKKVHGGMWIDTAIYATTLAALVCVLLGLVMPMIAGLKNDSTRALLITHVASVTAGYTLAIAGGILGLHYALRSVLANRTNRLLHRLLPKTVAMFSTAAVPITLLGVLLGAVWSAEHRGATFSWDLREANGSACHSSAGQHCDVRLDWPRITDHDGLCFHRLRNCSLCLVHAGLAAGSGIRLWIRVAVSRRPCHRRFVYADRGIGHHARRARAGCVTIRHGGRQPDCRFDLRQGRPCDGRFSAWHH